MASFAATDSRAERIKALAAQASNVGKFGLELTNELPGAGLAGQSSPRASYIGLIQYRLRRNKRAEQTRSTSRCFVRYINIYYRGSKRGFGSSISTVGFLMAHPRQGLYESFRVNVTDSELKTLLSNPEPFVGDGMGRASVLGFSQL